MDADPGMNGRDGQRHISHVRRSDKPFFAFAEIGECSPQRFGVPSVESRHAFVVSHLGVRLVTTGYRKFGAGGKASGLKTSVNPWPQLGELSESLGANDVLGRSVSGNDVRGSAAVSHNSMDSIRGTNVLTQQAQ